KLASRVGLSLDGLEGPGNYGLNKDCLMTIVVAKEDKVTASFALVQPGIADAPKVLEALASASPDLSPPPAEPLSGREGEGGAGRAAMEGRGDADVQRLSPRRPADLSRFDLQSEAGLRDAVKALIAEVERLRAEVAELRGASGGGAPVGAPGRRARVADH